MTLQKCQEKVKIKTTGLVRNFIIPANCWNHDWRSKSNGSMSYGVHEKVSDAHTDGRTALPGPYRRTPGENTINIIITCITDLKPSISLSFFLNIYIWVRTIDIGGGSILKPITKHFDWLYNIKRLGSQEPYWRHIYTFTMKINSLNSMAITNINDMMRGFMIKILNYFILVNAPWYCSN